MESDSYVEDLIRQVKAGSNRISSSESNARLDNFAKEYQLKISEGSLDSVREQANQSIR